MNKKSFGNKLVASPYIVWSAIFIIVPLVIMFYFALTDNNGVFTLANITAIGKYKKAFGISILYAAVSTVITLMLAYPMAYFMTKLKISSQRMLFMIVMIPMWMNFLIRTYSWITILSNTGLINTFLQKIGLIDKPIKLLLTPGAVILGMVYDYIPYMILPIYSVMSKLDKSLLEAAEDLGSNSFTKFKRVIFPLTKPGVISGITMVFVPSVSTFYISQKLGGTKTMLIGDTIEYFFNSGPEHYNIASAISMVLMVMILVWVMNGFSTRWYAGLTSDTAMMSALQHTLIIAVSSALISTVLGTAAAVGITAIRRKMPKKIIMSVTQIPMMNADIVTGISLMLLFIFVGKLLGLSESLGFLTVLISHITFNLPYVILSVIPKLKQTDPNLPEAAMDLGCTPVKAFFKVMLPSISTGIITGFIMAFTLSLDDFVISYFTCGHYQTLPIVIYSMTKKTVKPDAYALSTLIFITVFVLLILYNVLQSKSEKKSQMKERI